MTRIKKKLKSMKDTGVFTYSTINSLQKSEIVFNSLSY